MASCQRRVRSQATPVLLGAASEQHWWSCATTTNPRRPPRAFRSSRDERRRSLGTSWVACLQESAALARAAASPARVSEYQLGTREQVAPVIALDLIREPTRMRLGPDQENSPAASTRSVSPDSLSRRASHSSRLLPPPSDRPVALVSRSPPIWRDAGVSCRRASPPDHERDVHFLCRHRCIDLTGQFPPPTTYTDSSLEKRRPRAVPLCDPLTRSAPRAGIPMRRYEIPVARITRG